MLEPPASKTSCMQEDFFKIILKMAELLHSSSAEHTNCLFKQLNLSICQQTLLYTKGVLKIIWKITKLFGSSFFGGV